MMELLALCLAVLAGALAWRVYRQREILGERAREVHCRDAEIRRLRERLSRGRSEYDESKALYATIANVAADLVLLLDAELTVVMLNQPAERLFGRRNPIGQSLSAVTASPELLNLVQVALTGEDNLEEQFVLAGANYRARTHIVKQGESLRYIGVALQDISDLVNLNRARRDLVANISHELRTPITRIRLIIEGLFLDADKPKRKASIQSLKEIAMETDALLWLAQELLDLSMIESGEAILRLVKTPLPPLVDEAVDRLDAQAEMKDLKIVSHVPQNFDVLCDADQLKRVLANLIHNAIKWSPPGESVTITATERDDEVMIAVFDNGPGVPDALRERVFERFYQADVSRSGDEGAGLGLAICKHIIEAHGGRIWADGNGQGSGGKFLFTLLRADASFQQDAPAGESDRAHAAASGAMTPL